MALSEFLANHREEILGVCRDRLREDFAEVNELDHDIELFFEEIATAARRHDLHAGAEPGRAPRIVGALASAIAVIGERCGLSLGVERRPLRVATILRQLQASAMPERGISVTLEVDESLHVEADEILLWSAVGSLLHNAIEFSRSDGHITLSCRAEDGDVLIEVEDECGGLPATSPLLQLAADDAAQNGAGFTIARRAATAMDGIVYVKNCPGQGCICGMSFAAARPTRSSSRPPVL